MAKIAILGTGAWGTALGNVLLRNGHDVLMYGIDKKEINDLKKGLNTKYFGNNKMYSFPKTSLYEDDVFNFVSLINNDDRRDICIKCKSTNCFILFIKIFTSIKN